jgi:hypothetical protein
VVGRKPPGGGLGRWWCGFVGGGARRDGRDQLMDGWIDVSEWMGLSEMNEAGRRHKEHMHGFLSRRRIRLKTMSVQRQVCRAKVFMASLCAQTRRTCLLVACCAGAMVATAADAVVAAAAASGSQGA